MRKNLLSVICAAAFAFVECAIGVSAGINLIVGGEVAERDQFPYLVQIKYNTLHACGGAILNENWILTTAKCIAEPDMYRYEVIANQYNIDQTEGLEQERNISGIFLEPLYLPGLALRDIALAKLSTPLTFGSFVQPISLPAANHTPVDGVDATISGWGTKQMNGREEPIVQFVQVPIINDTYCDDVISKENPARRVGSAMICAGQNGAGFCIGDMGGPLVANDLPGGTPYVVGVASWLLDCAKPGLPEVYTEVSHYLDWILETIENN